MLMQISSLVEYGRKKEKTTANTAKGMIKEIHFRPDALKSTFFSRTHGWKSQSFKSVDQSYNIGL